MRIYVSDFEAFKTSDNIFLVKEICFINLLNPVFDTKHSLLTVPMKNLNKQTARYLTKYHHRLPIATIYDEDQLPFIPNGSILLIKGYEKTEHLRKLYPHCIVLDPFSNNVTSLSNFTIYSNCEYFNHGQHCAYKKCLILLKHFHMHT